MIKIVLKLAAAITSALGNHATLPAMPRIHKVEMRIEHRKLVDSCTGNQQPNLKYALT